MVHLLGLQGVPSADQGFVYTHPESGYIFELRDAAPTSYDSSDDEAPGNDVAKEPEELEYRPLQLGTVSQVTHTSWQRQLCPLTQPCRVDGSASKLAVQSPCFHLAA